MHHRFAAVVRPSRLPQSLSAPIAALIALLLLCVCLAPQARAQSLQLPLSVQVQGDTATAVLGLPLLPIADITLEFEQPQGLTASSLGLTAQLVSVTDPALLARLPQSLLTPLDGAFPLLPTIEPPTTGGLSFQTVRAEVHTHALVYTPGSSYRLFKASLGGPFVDITDEVAPGSVRARGTTGGFSQFLVLIDLRTSGTVIAEKIGRLRSRVNTLALSERQPFHVELNQVEAALAVNDYVAALAAVDRIRSRAESRAGNQLPDRWLATRLGDNQAGDLIAGAATLRFSIAYLRDYGQ
jgi:hypothetical protein